MYKVLTVCEKSLNSCALASMQSGRIIIAMQTAPAAEYVASLLFSTTTSMGHYCLPLLSPCTARV